jgi:hypothetical protein
MICPTNRRDGPCQVTGDPSKLTVTYLVTESNYNTMQYRGRIQGVMGTKALTFTKTQLS